MARFQIGERLKPKDKRLKAIEKLLIRMRRSPFYQEFLDIYSEPYGLNELLKKDKNKAPLMPLRSQDQDQEQDITPPYPPQGGEGVPKPEPTKSMKAKKPNGKLSKAQQALFDRFWEKYPKRKSKGQAMTAWKIIEPDEQLVEAMISKIKRAKTSDAWVKEGGRFIPHPATWLNAMGWEDEYDVNDKRGKEETGNEFSGKKYTGTPINEIPWICDENV